MSYFNRFENAVHKMSRLMILICATSLFLMMMLTTCDVVGRYMFSRPLKGTQDLVELGLVLCAFGGLGYATSRRQHIRSDMLNAVLSKRNNAIVGAVSFLISLPAGIVLAWKTCQEGVRIMLIGNSVTPTISVPVGPFYLFAGLGLILFCIEILLDVVKHIKEARTEHYAAGNDDGVLL